MISAWSAKRRILYGGGFVLVLAVIASLLFFHFFYRAPSCSDGVQNGNETDKDCGGTGYVEAGDAGTTLTACSPCADTKKCSASTDCTHGDCYLKVCVSCTDGIKDGTETDVDCGGGACAAGAPSGAACRAA